MHMNVLERRNVLHRLITALIVGGNLAFTIYVMVYLFLNKPQNLVVSLIACFFASLMMIFEIIFTLKGWKKESSLYKIGFNPNGTINTIPIIAIIVASIFATGLLLLATLLNVYKHFEPNISTSFVIMIASIYLLSNIIIYLLYIFMFKKREVNLKSLIK